MKKKIIFTTICVSLAVIVSVGAVFNIFFKKNGNENPKYLSKQQYIEICSGVVKMMDKYFESNTEQVRLSAGNIVVEEKDLEKPESEDYEMISAFYLNCLYKFYIGITENKNYQISENNWECISNMEFSTGGTTVDRVKSKIRVKTVYNKEKSSVKNFFYKNETDSRFLSESYNYFITEVMYDFKTKEISKIHLTFFAIDKNGNAMDKNQIGGLIFVEIKKDSIKVISTLSEKYDLLYEEIKEQTLQQKGIEWGDNLIDVTNEYQDSFG